MAEAASFGDSVRPGSHFSFGNLWYDEEVQDKQYYVELRLAPATRDFAYLRPDGAS